MQVSRLDPDTLRALWTVPIADASALDNATQIAGNAAMVWVSSGHEIEQLDAQSGARLRSVNLTLRTSSTQIYLTLDPNGQVLYVAYGDGGGSPQPLQKRDARTGEFSSLAPTDNPTAAGGFTAPQLVATDAGVWVLVQGEHARGQLTASLFRASDLKQVATLHGTEGAPFGGALALGGHTLWTANADLVACSDARTGRLIHYWGPLGSDPSVKTYADSIAADATSVAVSIRGTLGIFSAHDLCPQEK
jgi:hypothetical protein